MSAIKHNLVTTIYFIEDIKDLLFGYLQCQLIILSTASTHIYTFFLTINSYNQLTMLVSTPVLTEAQVVNIVFFPIG